MLVAKAWINERSLRERAILCLTVVGLTVMAFTEFVLYPSYQALDQQFNVLDEKQYEILALQSSLDGLSHQMEKDPDEARKLKNSQMKQQLERQRRELNRLVAGLVPPSEMTELLHTLLKRSQGIRLVEMYNMRPERVFGDADDNDAVSLYRHRVRLEFEAGYFETLAYVSALEAQKDRLRLARIDYRVTEYPRARVVVVVETLGMNKEWISV